jgi:hypothetical protein
MVPFNGMAFPEASFWGKIVSLMACPTTVSGTEMMTFSSEEFFLHEKNESASNATKQRGKNFFNMIFFF